MKTFAKISLFFLICIAIGLGIGAAAFKATWLETKRPITAVVQTIVKPEPAPITITFVGDIMLDRGVENSVNRNFGGDFNSFLSIIKPFLETSDITFGNLEGPVGTKGPNVGSAYSFQMNPIILPALKNAGFDILSFANNHVGDRSTIGFTESLQNLRAAGMLITGAGDTKSAAEQPTIIDVRGKKIGFIGFTDVGPNWLAATETRPGILLLSDPNLENIVKNAKSQVDILIVSIHWGNEYLPATDRQKSFAHNMIDWGADSIIGHHPHVIQTTEWYNGKFIAYSLGNFVFDQYFSDPTLQGLIVQMSILENNEITIDQKIVEMSRQYQPIEVREPGEADYITRGRVASQACPAAKEADIDLWLTPVGPDREIGNYVPKKLVPMSNRIDARGTATCLADPAATAVITMFETMEKLGMKPVMTSGFRSRAVQEAVYKGKIPDEEHSTETSVYQSVALPGHSEHQLGTTIDIKSATADELSYDSFYLSNEYAWMVENAADYGFVQSYQKGSESITGYISEPWHWRYVGKDHAKEIKRQGITLYEYLKSLEENN